MKAGQEQAGLEPGREITAGKCRIMQTTNSFYHLYAGSNDENEFKWLNRCGKGAKLKEWKDTDNKVHNSFVCIG